MGDQSRSSFNKKTSPVKSPYSKSPRSKSPQMAELPERSASPPIPKSRTSRSRSSIEAGLPESKTERSQSAGQLPSSESQSPSPNLQTTDLIELLRKRMEEGDATAKQFLNTHQVT